MPYGSVFRSLRTATLLLVLSPCVAAAEDLVDDYSRGDLLRYSMSIGPNARAFPDGFTFPNDAKPRPELLFGVDVSHYDGVINWSRAREQEIRFAYVKATQGVQSTDNTLARNWADIGKVSPAAGFTVVLRSRRSSATESSDRAPDAQIPVSRRANYC
jgi:GH25 family lysozyme M1 (1,4-beta-N-acetylmuramidase)